MLYEVGEDNNMSFLVGYGIAFGMSMELLGYSPGKKTEQELTNKYNNEKEKIPCFFYEVESNEEI